MITIIIIIIIMIRAMTLHVGAFVQTNVLLIDRILPFFQVTLMTENMLNGGVFILINEDIKRLLNVQELRGRLY